MEELIEELNTITSILQCCEDSAIALGKDAKHIAVTLGRANAELLGILTAMKGMNS